MSACDNSSPDLWHRPSHSVNVKRKFFAYGSVSNFNSSSPDLSTIVEESPCECCFPDDPGQLSINIDTEVFTRPGRPVRGGGDKARAVVKKIVGAVTLTFIFIIMSCFSWFSTAVNAFSAVVSSVQPIRAPHTLSFFSIVLVAIMLLSLLAPVASSYVTPSINSTLAELGIYNTSAIALAAFWISGATADTYFIDSC
eukprot:3027219-Rhodomonas_salina.1